MFPSHADLHLHTTRSDGERDPAALAEYIRSERPDLELVAVADRDTIAGSLRLAALLPDIVLPAVELSTHFHDHEVGLVALGVTDASRLAGALRRSEIEQVRWATIRRNQPRLDLPMLLPLDATSAAVTLAQVLIEQADPAAGVVDLADPAAHLDLARRLEAAGGMADCGRDLSFLAILPELTAAIEIAHRAGALAIVARPGATPGWYDPISDLRALALIYELDGFEAYRPEHPTVMRTKLVQLAYRMDMVASVGSGARLISDPIGVADGRPSRALRAEIDRRARAWR